jgi:hypothetical protein
MKSLMNNRGGVADSLASNVYGQQALVPASPWLRSHAPARPKVTMVNDVQTGAPILKWKAIGKDATSLWVVQWLCAGEWSTQILPGSTQSLAIIPNSPQGRATEFAVSAVDRYGLRSAPASADMDDDQEKDN